ncbi:hypothetical protein IscW_ISCW003618 [Ixodes scapularis]|uniref:Nose resistant-to-fluoxetine protein N-terminal domain-containing protein n=1 Tax=Ixodes scapularis TaxID=6945 RepID=B7PDT8_IXOSC|nr:hypothetical protein IscW_ISCW003618 [Ixodes scapularis]|eukprot:XP_002399251.1 hypothetical protein IscW_ISCW003618 [Ixodes scapularis]
MKSNLFTVTKTLVSFSPLSADKLPRASEPRGVRTGNMLLATTSRSPWLRRLPLIAAVLCVARVGVQADEFSTRTPVVSSPNTGIDNLRGLRTVRPELRNSSHPGVNTPRFPSDSGAGSAGSLLGARYVPVVNLENPPTSGRRPGRDHRRRIERSLDLSSGASDWDDPGKYFSGAVRTFARRLWPAVQELVADDAISTQCASSLLLLYAGVRRYRHWALNFVDASGRLPSGLLGGRAWDPGEYDQCLSIAAVLEGSYCTVRWNISRTAFVNRLTASAPPGSTRQHVSESTSDENTVGSILH